LCVYFYKNNGATRHTNVLLDSYTALSLSLTEVHKALLQCINAFCKLAAELVLSRLVLYLDGILTVEFRVKPIDVLGRRFGSLQQLQHRDTAGYML